MAPQTAQLRTKGELIRESSPLDNLSLDALRKVREACFLPPTPTALPHYMVLCFYYFTNHFLIQEQSKACKWGFPTFYRLSQHPAPKQCVGAVGDVVTECVCHSGGGNHNISLVRQRGRSLYPLGKKETGDGFFFSFSLLFFLSSFCCGQAALTFLPASKDR